MSLLVDDISLMYMRQSIVKEMESYINSLNASF